MVRIEGQLDLRYVPFNELINPQTFKTEVRFMPAGSDGHRLARVLRPAPTSWPTGARAAWIER